MSRQSFARAWSVSLLLVLAVGTSPASAATETIKDRVKDAAAEVDLTRLTVDESKKRVAVTAAVRNLSGKGVLRLSVGNGGEIYHVIVTKRSGAPTVKVGSLDPLGGSSYDVTYTCDGLGARWDTSRNVITVSITKAGCLPAFDFINGARMEIGKKRDVLGTFSTTGG